MHEDHKYSHVRGKPDVCLCQGVVGPRLQMVHSKEAAAPSTADS